MLRTYYITTQPTRFGLTIKVRAENEQKNNTERVAKKCRTTSNKIDFANGLKMSLDNCLDHFWRR